MICVYLKEIKKLFKSISQKNQDVDGQDSRLSARFFLAASTPFKDQSATLNWLYQSSFHKSTPESIHQDYTMDTPSSTVMGYLYFHLIQIYILALQLWGIYIFT